MSVDNFELYFVYSLRDKSLTVVKNYPIIDTFDKFNTVNADLKEVVLDQIESNNTI